MPVYLPPLSRRQFIAGSAAAASTLISGGLLRAANGPTAPDAHRFALLSDTHVAGDRAATMRGVTMAENLARAVADVTASSPRPAAAVVNGDLALGTGQSADYATLIELFEPLRQAGVPVLLGLGNHDHRDRFRAALPAKDRIETPFKARQVYQVESPRADWFVLDSLRETNEVAGAVGEGQLRWLADALAARDNKPALVVVHHNPDPEDPTRGGLFDTHALLELLAARRRVKALVFGHSHAWSVRQEDGLYLINLPPVAYVFKEGMPNGWVDVRLTETGATLELRCIDPAQKQHGERHELTWRNA